MLPIGTKKFYYGCIRAAVMFLFAELNVTYTGFVCGASSETTSTSSSSETLNVGKLRASAEVAFTKGEIEQALRIWQQVIDIEPQNEQNFFKRYRVYIRQQKLKEALADLNSALQINPTNENILVSRGKLHLKLGKCSEAVHDFELLRRLNPNNKDIASKDDAFNCQNAIVEAERAYDRKQWSVSRDFINHALRYAESSTALLMRRAFCYFFLEEQYETIADTGRVLKLESDNLEALELRGRAYYILGELDTAMNHYRKGLKFDPEHKGIKDMYRIIKKVQDYQKKAKKYSSSGDGALEEELRKAEAAAEAYEILSDNDKRAAYDRGEDVTGGQQFHFQFG
eukprot:gene30586-39854_t